ncbi:MAG TPA: DUF4097 family beta strand repeat-containing protein [Terracidiphilus sp.]|nr:DUF4097 family beta strand repeat-containing protein [Terracidiphilus sp.]
MSLLRSAALSVAALVLLATTASAHADEDWQKTYAVSAHPSLSFTTGDSSAEVRSCGDCKEIRIRVQWNERHASAYTLTEAQTGDHVNFELREKPGFGMHIYVGNHRGPVVTIETPASIDLEGRTADGSLKVYGIQGDLQLHTSDGAVDVADTAGSLHLKASDGAIRIHNASGTLESRSSDGSVHIDGRFSGVQVHVGDGGLDLTLNDGSSLTTASSIESSDGRVTIHLPHNLAADLDVHTGDGHLDCNVPLVMEGYHSNGESSHGVRGRLNGGGVPLTIRTHDGNVTIASL